MVRRAKKKPPDHLVVYVARDGEPESARAVFDTWRGAYNRASSLGQGAEIRVRGTIRVPKGTWSIDGLTLRGPGKLVLDEGAVFSLSLTITDELLLVSDRADQVALSALTVPKQLSLALGSPPRTPKTGKRAKKARRS